MDLRCDFVHCGGILLQRDLFNFSMIRHDSARPKTGDIVSKYDILGAYEDGTHNSEGSFC